MKDEPEIVKDMRKFEKFGKLGRKPGTAILLGSLSFQGILVVVSRIFGICLFE